MHPAKLASQQQWDTDPCAAETVAGPAPGSPQYYAAIREHRFTEYGPWFDRVMRFDDVRGKRILEIGVGLGSDHFRFARAGNDMTALDLSIEHLRQTSRHLGQERLATGPVRGDAEVLPFADASFDVVYSFGVLHHTPDTKGAVREIHRVLRPGGVAVIGLYHRNSIFFYVQTLFVNGLVRAGLFRKGWRRLLSEIEFRSPDNPAVPLVKLYSRRSAAALFSSFSAVDVQTCHVEASHFSLFRRLLGGVARAALERRLGRLGWYVVVRATR